MDNERKKQLLKNVSPILDVYEDAKKEIVNPPKGFGIARWPKLDEMIGGFRGKEYTIFCAPTGIGKTQFLANISVELMRAKHKQFIMSVETGETDYVKRMMSALSQKPFHSGRAYSKEEVEIFQKQFGAYFQNDFAWLGLYTNRVPVKDLIDLIKIQHAMDNKFIIIDNLNFFMEPISQQNMLLEMDRVTHELIMLCKQIDIHIIMVQHPKKTETGRVENEFDIKGSSTAVQEAHNVMVLNRPKQTDVDDGIRNQTDRQLLMIKNRKRGEAVGKSVWFNYMGGCYVESR